ncbi:MAG TPA: hypothetical protein VF641_12125 [Methylobacterium sp.]|jgi:hypothetical protein
MIEFFDKDGRATAFCDYGKDLYLWDGRPAAVIVDDTVFAYSGRFIGWVEDGWISDARGGRLLFEFDAVGGPVKPSRITKPPMGTRGAKLAKGAREPVPSRPVRGLAWSETTFAALI